MPIQGEFLRKDSIFRKFVTADGSSGFKAEKGRYHLYVSYACPWACRTLMYRNFKGLQDVISFTVVDHFMGEKGWRFSSTVPGCSPDPIMGKEFLREIYFDNDPNYDGKFTVPILFDKETKRIVNNESSEIIRMLNTEFNAFCATEEQRKLDFYPETLRSQIDEINAWVYPNINNGVYRCGFATAQEAFDIAYKGLFEHLEKAEEILSKNRYLTGDQFTEADIRLFPTLIRFDAVYVVHFKTNLKMIKEFPNLQNYVKEIYQMPLVKETVDFMHIKHHYYRSHQHINTYRIVPEGPILDFDSPHNRGEIKRRDR